MYVVSKRTRVLSLLLGLLAFAILSGLAVVIFRGIGARNLLESKNDCQRTINVLFSSLRSYDSFGAAVEGIPILREKVVAISVFDAAENLLYSWGAAPGTYPSVKFAGDQPAGRFEEMFIGNPKGNSQIVLVRPLRPPEPSPQNPPPEPPPERHHEDSFMSSILRRADLILFEIRQPEYWKQERLQSFFFPVTVLLLLFLVGFVRFLVMKNAEYRHEAERQKNLVMLGTAASTLAHEIKNPLLAIRLQTEILARSLEGRGGRELAIIDGEVERLAQLSVRVNDVLRDPTGSPDSIDPAEVASEVGVRLCGSPIVSVTGTDSRAGRTVRMDPDRLRSIVENLVRNALESGGTEDEVAVEITVNHAHVFLDVLDRGSGVAEPDREKAFDPFFTTKSRGTGIGLAICRRFASAAGGEITLEARPGGGLRARLSLPRADP